MDMHEPTIFPDLPTLVETAARICRDRAQEAIRQRGRFILALAGGNTPRPLYQRLTQAPFVDDIDWGRVETYFGDERSVPADHPDSNYRMARAALLDHVPIPPANIHRMDADPAYIRQAARRYAQIVDAGVPADAAGVPSFDLILLGMGPDGHTASLFPGTCVLHEQQRHVAAVYVDRMKTWRITLTLPVLNHARTLLFLVSGADKAPALARVFDAGDSGLPLPVQMLQPHGEVLWLMDSAAAGAALPR
jgi:6-phosphogluconolactonase